MLKHVLVPLDGSKLAEEALSYALQVVAPDGRITLVCAVEIPDTAYYGYYPSLVVSNNESTKNELVPIAKHYLEGLADEVTQKGIATRFEVTVGDAATVITEAAERLGVDAIVMSTHGRSGIGRFLFGSITGKVLGMKVCPVFVIPNKATVTQEQPEKAAELAH